MQQREKKLAAAFAVVVALIVLRPLFTSLFVDPLTERDATIKSTTAIVRSLEDRELELRSAMRALADYRARSLPPQADDAQREYSEWLNDLALLSNWRDPQLTLGPRSPRGDATVIPITIRAQATLDDVNRFLQRFESTALVQRVSGLKLESPGFEGNPLLDVELVAEGIAVAGADPRTRLFPTAALAAPINADDTTITPANADEFPTTMPFVVRLDRELLEVQSIADGQWTVARGVFGTPAAEHAVQTPIELLPTQAVAESTETLPAVQRLFVKVPDAGQLQLTADLAPAQRGREWTAALRLQNWDPALGTPQLRLSPAAPAGMQLDAADNTLVWTPPEDFPLGTVDVHVAALGRNGSTPVVEADLKVEVRRPNSPPQLTIPEEVDVWLGRPWQYELSAADGDLPNDKLTYSLGGTVPQGLTIDGDAGILNWSPPAEMDLGTFDVEITVTDSGQPPESDSRTLTLQLADDNALYTYFSGTIAVNGDREAWLYDRSTNRLTVVHTGEEFQIADVSGKAVLIDETAMEIESAGQIYRLQLGQNLRSWAPAGPSATPVNAGETGSSGESPGT